MSLLILSHAEDKGAVILFNHLTKNEIPCRLVIDIDLVKAREWLIRISDRGFHSYLKLQNNVAVIPEDYDFIYCRLRSFSLGSFGSFEDCSYASMEFQAMISGALAFMDGKMINPVHPVYLSLPTCNPLVINNYFRSAGMPVVNTAYSSGLKNSSAPGIIEEPLTSDISWATVINGKSIGPLGRKYNRQLLRLQEITRMKLLKVFFQKTRKSGWGAIYFTGITDFNDDEELNCFGEFLSAPDLKV